MTHILHIEKMLFGLSKQTLPELAFQMAAKNNAPLFHLINTEKKMAKVVQKFPVAEPTTEPQEPRSHQHHKGSRF